MNQSEVVSFINKSFAYKPNWTITAFIDGNDVSVRFHMEVPDSRPANRGQQLSVNICQLMPVSNAMNPWSKEEVVAWLSGQIRFLELHEMSEWIMVDGKTFSDPHADGDPYKGKPT